MLLLINYGYGNNIIVPITMNTIVYDKDKAILGQKLFTDVQLSGSQKLSCASCHDPDNGGADPNRRYSISDSGKQLKINTPTVLTSALNFRQQWNGKVKALNNHIDHVLQDPMEMNASWQIVVKRLNKDPEYQKMFQKIYSSLAMQDNISDALVEYMKSLVKPSRVDFYLNGDENALTNDEKDGYQLFKQYGCGNCHQGINIGGNLYQSLGIMSDFFKNKGHITEADFGRYNETLNERDRFVFKVPTLRNISLTAPYLHDGSIETLNDVVDVMFEYQLGRSLPEDEQQKIIQFLRALESI